MLGSGIAEVGLRGLLVIAGRGLHAGAGIRDQAFVDAGAAIFLQEFLDNFLDTHIVQKLTRTTFPRSDFLLSGLELIQPTAPSRSGIDAGFLLCEKSKTPAKPTTTAMVCILKFMVISREANHTREERENLFAGLKVAVDPGDAAVPEVDDVGGLLEDVLFVIVFEKFSFFAEALEASKDGAAAGGD